jgi:hypothetical protein
MAISRELSAAKLAVGVTVRSVGPAHAIMIVSLQRTPTTSIVPLLT